MPVYLGDWLRNCLSNWLRNSLSNRLRTSLGDWLRNCWLTFKGGLLQQSLLLRGLWLLRCWSRDKSLRRRLDSSSHLTGKLGWKPLV